MKIQILSDLHLEFGPFDVPEASADLLVLAGDIQSKAHGLKWAIESVPDRPVLYVMGNHEFYGGAHPKLIGKLKQAAAGTNVTVLENDAVEIGGIRFLGCTLWTNFELVGDPRIAGYHATQAMTDFRRIRRSPSYSKLRSIDASHINWRSIRWLTDTMAESPDQPTVVITHHAPSELSLPPERRGKIESAAYASHFDDLVLNASPELWVHGHIHRNSDYRIGTTRVVCNPRGYADSPNLGFQPDLVVEVPSP
jgi:Icc-related predicted phosphoesterase